MTDPILSGPSHGPDSGKAPGSLSSCCTDAGPTGTT